MDKKSSFRACLLALFSILVFALFLRVYGQSGLPPEQKQIEHPSKEDLRVSPEDLKALTDAYTAVQFKTQGKQSADAQARAAAAELSTAQLFYENTMLKVRDKLHAGEQEWEMKANPEELWFKRRKSPEKLPAEPPSKDK